MSNCIAIPVKRLSHAKTRLSVILTPGERSRLAAAMFQDVLAAAKHTPEVGRVLVVTSDEGIARLTVDSEAEVLPEDRTDGLNQAVSLAVNYALKLRMKRLLILHADLPLVRPQDIAQFLLQDPEVIIAPSHMHDGTNAMSLSPPDAIATRYGRRSFDKHLAVARSRGLEPLVIWNERIALDVDLPSDLKRLRGLHPVGFTREFFRDSSIVERMQEVDYEIDFHRKLNARTHLVAGLANSLGETPVMRRRKNLLMVKSVALRIFNILTTKRCLDPKLQRELSHV